MMGHSSVKSAALAASGASRRRPTQARDLRARAPRGVRACVGRGKIPTGALLMVGALAGLGSAQAQIAALDYLVVAMDNCANRLVVYKAPRTSIAKLQEVLTALAGSAPLRSTRLSHAEFAVSAAASAYGRIKLRAACLSRRDPTFSERPPALRKLCAARGRRRCAQTIERWSPTSAVSWSGRRAISPPSSATSPPARRRSHREQPPPQRHRAIADGSRPALPRRRPVRLQSLFDSRRIRCRWRSRGFASLRCAARQHDADGRYSDLDREAWTLAALRAPRRQSPGSKAAAIIAPCTETQTYAGSSTNPRLRPIRASVMAEYFDIARLPGATAGGQRVMYDLAGETAAPRPPGSPTFRIPGRGARAG